MKLIQFIIISLLIASCSKKNDADQSHVESATTKLDKAEDVVKNTTVATETQVGSVDSKEKTSIIDEVKPSLTPIVSSKPKLKKVKKSPKKITKVKTKVLLKPKKVKQEIEDEVALEQAAPVNNTIEGTVLPGATNSNKQVNQILDVTFNTDNRETQDGQKGYDTQMWYFLYYRLNSNYTARLWAIFEKDLSTSYKEKMGDTRLTLSHSAFQITENLKFVPSTSILLPTSEKSKRNEELNFGIELNPGFSYRAANYLNLSYLPRLAKNFHEYTTSRTNETNNEYRLIQFAVANYSFVENWYFEYSFIHSQSWAYTGTRKNPSYMSAFELGHNFTKELILAAGLIQGGSLVDRANGPDQTVQLFDENETTYYGKFALSF